MGDIWPYGAPAYITWQEAYNLIYNFTQRQDVASIMAAIGSAESSLDWTVINDTPSTGDYSVGIWQINYYGSLYSSRAAQFGTPKQLVQGGPGTQARAALAIAFGSGGYTNWSTYNDGAYKQYLHGFTGGTPTGGPGGQTPFTLPPAPGPGRDDYSRTVTEAGTTIGRLGATADNYARYIRDVRRRG